MKTMIHSVDMRDGIFVLESLASKYNDKEKKKGDHHGTTIDDIKLNIK